MASRSRKSLSLKEKMEILKKVDENPCLKRVDLANKLNLPVSTLNSLIYKRKEIEENTIQSGSNSSKKFRVQTGKFINAEKLLLQWFNQCRAENLPISGPLLMEKAKEISEKLNVECSASFSTGWLHKFKLRHGITGKTVSGESGDVDCETVTDWIENQLPEIIKGYKPRDIFNADETGLYYNLLPSKILPIKSDTCHGGKNSKSRLTVLLCANADGSEKLSPLIIGKSKKPRCFKTVKTLPTQYLANKKAWMTMSLFSDWLKELDKKMHKEKRHILLFIDQCPAHPPATDFLKNIKVKFFPANCTSKLQPLDLGVIKNMKQHYRKILVQSAIISLDNGDFEKMKIDVLQAMNFILMAWQNVSPKTIENCFAHGGFSFTQPDKNTVDRILDDPFVPPTKWANLNVVSSFAEFEECDSDLTTSSLLTIEEMIENEESSSEEEGNTPVQPKPSFKEALAGFNAMKAYLISGDISDNAKNALIVLNNELLSIHSKKTEQSQITNFFVHTE